jgi:hypothetical protein
LNIEQKILPQRTLHGLLEETFSVYWKHFVRLFTVAAIILIPSNLILALMLPSPSGLADSNPNPLVVLLCLAILTTSLVFTQAALANAIGQHYSTGLINIRITYLRLFGRVKTLSLLTIILTSSVLIGLIVVSTIYIVLLEILNLGNTNLEFLIIVPLIITAALGSILIQTVILEGHKVMDSLNRIRQLMYGNWWRISGISMILALVTVGLFILLQAPFLIWPQVSSLMGIVKPIQSLYGMLTSVIAIVLWCTAITLVYYDLRVRKEKYTFGNLSDEMNISITK